MSGMNSIAFVLLLLFISLLLFFTIMRHRWKASFRTIEPFDELGMAIERAVETGERIHLSLGTGTLNGQEAAPALAGLSMVERVITAAALSDRSTVVTTGDGSLMILAQDTLKRSYRRVRADERYSSIATRMLGPSPFTYVSMLPSLLKDEEVAVHILNGSFGTEGALAAAFGERSDAFVLSATDDIRSQAVIYATSGHSLIGEEVFAGGAYLNVGPMHKASLQTEDIIRWVIILIILGGTILTTMGVGL